MNKYYYVTAAAGKPFIVDYTQYALKSLIRAGAPIEDIHCVLHKKSEEKLIRKLVPKLQNTHVLPEKIDHVTWQYAGGKWVFAFFKAAAMHKLFGEPKKGKYLIHFDGDVLWYKNPSPFFDTKNKKTWYHHGKDLAKRATIKRSKVDIKSVKSLSKWVSEPCAYLMVKSNATRLPEREVVSGLYLLHPKDHAALLKTTYEGCKRNAKKFRRHEGGGEQKPMNAALNILNIDWHGGSRFFCPEHVKFFDHFFGSKREKRKFRKLIREMKL